MVFCSHEINVLEFILQLCLYIHCCICLVYTLNTCLVYTLYELVPKMEITPRRFRYSNSSECWLQATP